jgi:DNA-binding IscR family transcriptional regulator
VAEPDRITLLDVLRAVEPQNELFALHRARPNRECPVGRNICTVLKGIYGEVYESMAERLAGSTIANVVTRLGDEARDR